MNLQSYIHSGIIEAYVFGLMTPAEKNGFEQLLSAHPELQQALGTTQLQVEKLAAIHAVSPSPENAGSV